MMSKNSFVVVIYFMEDWAKRTVLIITLMKRLQENRFVLVIYFIKDWAKRTVRAVFLFLFLFSFVVQRRRDGDQILDMADNAGRCCPTCERNMNDEVCC